MLKPPDVKSQLTRKDPDAGKDWRQEEKGMTEDKMVGRHHRFNGHEFEQAPRDGEGQGGLACCSPSGCKRVGYNWTTEQNIYAIIVQCVLVYFQWICFKFFLVYHFVFSVMSLYLLICLIILLEWWTLCIKYCKGPGLWYPLSEKNRFYSVRKLEGRHCGRYYPASCLVPSLSNPFKDTGNPEAQLNSLG